MNATTAPPAATPTRPAADDLPAWTAALFRAIDARDVDGFLDFLTADASFVFGNFPAAVGNAAIRATLERFYAGIRALAHTVDDAWSVPGHAIVRGQVRYTRLEGATVEVPFCNVLGTSGGRVSNYRIYIDPSPLFAA